MKTKVVTKRNNWKKGKWLVFAMALIFGIAVGMIVTTGTADAAAQKNIALGASGQDSDEPITMAVGDYGQFSLDTTDTAALFYQYAAAGEIQSVSYASDDDVLSLTSDGAYRAVSVGEAMVTVTAQIQLAENLGIEAEYDYYIQIYPDMTNATLSCTTLEGYQYGDDYSSFEAEIQIQGVEGLTDDEDSDFDYQSSNSKMSVYCEQSGTTIQITAYGAGSTTITLTLYGKTWTVKLKIHHVRLAGSDSFCLVKGKTKQLKIKGSNQKVTWKSSNSKVVKISSNGKIRALKEGNVIITAKVGSGKVGCVVSAVSKKRKKVINTAIRIGKTCKYSQAKRMQSGYYDCSSLVWKAYRKMGISFGDKNYAPTAANNAKWCAANHKIVKGSVAKNVQKMKYLPGALMYETGATSNGRYKGIYHVEMFVGYTFEGFDSNGKAVVGMKWANRSDNYYGYIGLWSQP